MAADDHLNQNQLRMFMTPSELMSYATAESDWDDTEQEAWDRRANEAEDEGLTEDIVSRGVQHPIKIRHGAGSARIDDGHRRIAASQRLIEDDGRQRYLPVEHKF